MPKTAVRPRSGRSPYPSVAVVVSRYNQSVTFRLRDGALAAYQRAYPDAPGGSVVLVDAPGAYELPALSLACARTGRFEGVVALGCLIKGETSHDRYIAEAVAGGLVQVTVATGIPAAFGVLTVDTPQQAEDRAGGVHGNKGEEAMTALLDTIDQFRMLASDEPAPRGDTRRAVPDKAARRRSSRGGSR